MSHIKLTKSETQSDVSGANESSMSITVEYNHRFGEVVKLLSIQVYDFKTKKTTDITWIFREQYPAALEVLLDSIEWDKVYKESTHFRVHDAGVTVHDSVDVVKNLQSYFL